MFRKTMISSFFFSFFLLIANCEKNKNPITGPLEKVYTQLECNSFMKYSHEAIADSLAGILNVRPIEFNQIIQDKYEYLTDNNAKITVRINSDNAEAYGAEYLLKWRGDSDEWSYDSTKVDSMIMSVLRKVGIFLDETEEYKFYKRGGLISGRICRWYEIKMNQTFRDSVIYQPFLDAQIEGNTGEVNNIYIGRWYYNLHDIKEALSTDSLEVIAKDYFLASDEVLSIPDSLINYGYNILYDKLCRKIGPAIIDEYGSELYVFIDVQDGEIVSLERHPVD